ncbi:MAG: hypothetical protein ABIR31_02640 [Ginsengibacter sp.]
MTASKKIIKKTGNLIIKTTQSQTEEKMEVHAHTHSGHEKKTLKEYFWEFLMLFLAVFCGFLAEYQLEHVIEHQRERQYIESLTSDLRDDIKSLDSNIAFEHIGIGELDTLIYLLDNASLAKQNGDQLYYVARMGPRFYPFANNGRTFDQLRNSGGFRLIRNAAASNDITGYYGQFSQIRLLEDNYNYEFDNYKRVAAKIFEPGILRRQEGDEGEILRSKDNPQLRTYDADLLKELSFHALQMNGSRRSRLTMLKNLETVAKELMATLKKDYRLE